MTLTPDQSLLVTVGTLGAVIGVCKLLVTGTPLKWQLVVGNAGVSSGIALGCLSLLAAFPSLGPVPLIGVAAATAVLGTVGLEKLLERAILRERAVVPPPVLPETLSETLPETPK